jgi:NAD(P)-dependent dehydrogenase (short-subunit alcohol dehydrogenase family)
MRDAVFICGVSRGIGLELASLFCAEGRTVYGISRSPEPERSIEGLVYRRSPAETFSLSTFPELSAQAIDTVVLNSAVLGPATQFSFELPVAMLKAMFDTNVISHYRVLQELLPLIKTGAKVWFIISKGGLHARIQGRVALGYRSTKAAQIALALSLVEPLSERGISVYLIHPGSVATRIGGARAKLTAEEGAVNVKTVLSRAGELPSGTIFDHDGKLIDLGVSMRKRVEN